MFRGLEGETERSRFGHLLRLEYDLEGKPLEYGGKHIVEDRADRRRALQAERERLKKGVIDQMHETYYPEKYEVTWGDSSEEGEEEGEEEEEEEEGEKTEDEKEKDALYRHAIEEARERMDAGFAREDEGGRRVYWLVLH
jgi:hypothetical protein